MSDVRYPVPGLPAPVPKAGSRIVGGLAPATGVTSFDVSDTAVAADVVDALALAVAESAVGADAALLTVALTATDAATASDTAPTLAKPGTDAAVGADASSVTAVLPASDVATGVESILSLSRPVADSATASDAVTTLDAGASNVVSDSGTATDTAVLTQVSFIKVSGNRGSSNEKVSDTSLGLVIGAGVTVPIGHFLLLAAVVDNHTNTSPGGNSTYLSVTDTQSNTWTRTIEQATDSATAETGIIAGLYLCKVSTALTTGDIITITVPAASTAKAMGLVEYDVGTGNDMVPVATAGVVANAATSYSVPITGLPSGDYLFIGFSAVEGEVDAAVDLDSAYAEIGLGSIGSS